MEGSKSGWKWREAEVDQDRWESGRRRQPGMLKMGNEAEGEKRREVEKGSLELHY